MHHSRLRNAVSVAISLPSRLFDFPWRCPRCLQSTSLANPLIGTTLPPIASATTCALCGANCGCTKIVFTPSAWALLDQGAKLLGRGRPAARLDRLLLQSVGVGKIAEARMKHVERPAAVRCEHPLDAPMRPRRGDRPARPGSADTRARAPDRPGRAPRRCSGPESSTAAAKAKRAGRARRPCDS